MGRLFWKIFAGFWVTLLLTVIGVSTALQVREEARRASADAVIAQGRRISYALRQTVNVARYGGEPALRAMLGDWPGTEGDPPLVVNGAGQDLLGREVPASALTAARQLYRDDPNGRSVRSWTAPQGSYLIFVPASFARVPDRPPPLLPIETPLAAAIAALLASVAISALLARNFSQPIRTLQNAFQAAAHGELAVRVAPGMAGRRDEIGQLGREFDGMAQKLQALVSSQQRLLHDVSHELRSPLARLQVAVGLARQNPAQVDTALDRIERESERLVSLVGEIITLSRLEGQRAGGGEEYVDFVELLASVVDDARFEAGSSGRRVNFLSEVEGEILLRARGELLHRAVDNIVRNALHHTPADGEVALQLTRDAGGDLHLCVRDRGPGVPEAELEAIFEPFFRSAQAGSGGYGLGLAIARRAVAAHGGQMWAANRKGGGLEIHLTLPPPSGGPA